MRYNKNIRQHNDLDEIAEEIIEMPDVNAAMSSRDQIDLEALDALLDDLPLDASQAEVIEEPIEEVEEVVEEVAAELDDDVLRDLEIGMERAEAYGRQESTVETADAEAVAKAKKEAPAKKARTSAAASTPRVPRDISTVADEFFVLSGDPAAMSQDELLDARAATMALKPTQKKIAEKFENLFTAISVGKQPSRYVSIAFELLDQNSTITSTDLVACYKTAGSKSPTEGYDEGTARSQTGQIMALFDAVGIAKRSGSSLTINPDSLIAQRLRGIIKTA